MENDKYVVFKVEDWQYLSRYYDTTEVPEAWKQRMLSDAVVIRPQDIFAGPGLYAYANAIQTAIDLMVVQDDIVGGILDNNLLEHLVELRDFFTDQALEAVNHLHKKVPD